MLERLPYAISGAVELVVALFVLQHAFFELQSHHVRVQSGRPQFPLNNAALQNTTKFRYCLRSFNFWIVHARKRVVCFNVIKFQIRASHHEVCENTQNPIRVGDVFEHDLVDDAKFRLKFLANGANSSNMRLHQSHKLRE